MADDWFKAQQNLWRTWQTALDGHAAPTPDWGLNMGAWWRMLSDGKTAAEKLAEVQRFFEHGKDFMSFAQMLQQAAGHKTAQPQGGLDVAAAFTSMLQDIAKAMSGPGAENATQTAEFLRFLSWPVENWRGVLGDRGDSALSAYDPAALGDLFKLALGSPSVGLAREWDARVKTIYECAGQQQKAYDALLQEHGRIARSAIDLFTVKVNEPDTGEAGFATAKALYDLWVDCAEQVYRDVVMTDGYARAYGKFTNAAMDTRRHVQGLRDALLEAVDMPNRPELNTLIERQRNLEKAVARITARLDETGDSGLRKHIEVLTDEVNELREKVTALESPADVAPARSPPAATPRPPAKKRAARRSGKKTASVQRNKEAPAARPEFDIDEITLDKDR